MRHDVGTVEWWREAYRGLEEQNAEKDAKVATLRNLAEVGLRAYHGSVCDMGGGPYPSNPAECEDPYCVKWVKALIDGAS